MSDASMDARIAIVGMAGRFPGAADVEELWQNLRHGREAVRFLDEEEALRRGVSRAQWDDPRFVPAVSETADVDCFDAMFFGFNPREAEYLDPQQRIFLECAWEALEDAGLNPGDVAGSSAGVFAGATTNTYLMFNLLPRSRGEKAWDPMSLLIGNAVDTLATRTAYKLDLQGPAFTVQCACSTSLVAVHLAAESLLNEECDLALAGGVSVNVHLRQGYRYEEGSIASPDGHCRAFDAKGRGSIFGSGVGVVALKRLEDARADGDPVRAVLLGSAINNDGSRKVGYTAPSVEGQAKVITQALEVSGVDPETISYVEAHGTATALGDPIEIEALTRAFGGKTEKKQFCAIGSVKTNVGHLDVAAGITGLIKTVLALEHGEIPPSLHFEEPNPQIDFAGSPVYVARELQEWRSVGAPRRAGVSSFGIGGTNVHVIVEEAPEREPSGPSRAFQLLLFSARRREALGEAAARLAGHLAERGDAAAELADVAYTLRTGRASFEHRRMLVCGNCDEAVRLLRGEEPERLLSATPPPGGRTVAFLLPGIGEHYPGMARDLYRREPVFRAALDRCAEIAAPHLDHDLREVLYPEGSDAAGTAAGSSPGKLDLRGLLGRSPQAADMGELAHTRFAHPAVFAVEYALAKQWASWGVRPRAMIGHSLGEYVAATLAGVISLEEALPLVVRRARLIDELPGGAMLAVVLPEAEVVPRLGDGLWIAAVNSPDVSVVAGEEEAVRDLADRLAQDGVVTTRLPARHAFHSAMMEPAAEALVAGFGGCALRAPEIPFISNVTGRFITAEEATDPSYWARHLCRTVRFADGLRELLAAAEGQLLLEVGPGQGLGALALGAAGDETRAPVVVSSLRSRHERQPDQAFLLTALGRAWLAGVEVDWGAFDASERRWRVSLPSYPFERHRYWIEPDEDGVAVPRSRPEAPEAPESRAPVGSLHDRPELAVEYVAPRNELERRVAGIWQELLGMEAVGVHDSFFHLGGHSLLAIQLVAQMRDVFQAELSLERIFANPTVAALARALESAAGEDVAPPMVRVSRQPGEFVPLSFAQERMWLLDQLDPGSYVYNLYFPYRIRGALRLEVLRRAFEELVRRHEVLRTTFVAERGQPFQVIGPGVALELPVVDLAHLPAPLRERQVAKESAEENRRGFDLARGPLLRTKLLRLAAEEHVLLFSLHHIVSDGWSMAVAVRELTALYDHLAGGRPPSLPELPIQYADFAVWQRRWLEQSLDELLVYWRQQLADRPPPPRLAGDRPRDSVQGFHMAAAELRLAGQERRALERLGRIGDATLFMTLLAAFDALLYRYTGESDVVVGAPIANRNRVETAGLVGFFLNTLVLRVRLCPGAGFRELLAEARRVALAAFAYEELPLELLIGGLRETPSSGDDPELFRAMVLVQNVPTPEIRLAGLELEPVTGIAEAVLNTDVFELSLVAEDFADGLGVQLIYNGLLFDQVTAVRLLGHFRNLLAGAAADPGQPLAELPLLSAAEGRELLGGYVAAPAGGGALVHEQIVAQAWRRPAAPAVVWGGLGGGGTLSYGELAACVHRLAAHLVGLGVAPEVRVVLWLERSPELVVALLATLHAGGAYVPLEPSIPAERRDLILADVERGGEGVAVILTTRLLAPELAATAGVPVVSVDLDAALFTGPPPDASPVAARPENAAYVIYTSGSTGTPKGVVVEHRALAAFTAAAAETYAVSAADRVLQFASISFDTSVEEIFPTLTRGAALVLRDEEMLGSAPALLAACREHGVTVLDLPTAFWHPWVSGLTADAETLGAPLRLVILGGEQVDRAALAAWRPRVEAAVDLYNTYGPTEATVVATWSDLSCPPEDGVEMAPIGRPLGAARAWVVERGLRLAPRGVPGELLLGGPGLARGYLGRPGPTAAGFVPDPFTGTPGGRLYRTGDLVRLRNDGELEFLGRLDHQVKVRGFRVELGEIEATLRRHPAVGDAVVTVLAADAGPRLVAWTENGTSAAAPGEGELRAFLASRLPEYMVPVLYVTLESLPRTPSGKADRAALARRDVAWGDAGRSDVATPYVAPDTDAEIALAGIFAELLAVPRVGVEDDFFELGGHSLLLPQALYRLREAFDVEVPLRDFYDDPTVAGLADLVEDLILDEIEGRPERALAGSAQVEE